MSHHRRHAELTQLQRKTTDTEMSAINVKTCFYCMTDLDVGLMWCDKEQIKSDQIHSKNDVCSKEFSINLIVLHCSAKHFHVKS